MLFLLFFPFAYRLTSGSAVMECDFTTRPAGERGACRKIASDCAFVEIVATYIKGEKKKIIEMEVTRGRRTEDRCCATQRQHQRRRKGVIVAAQKRVAVSRWRDELERAIEWSKKRKEAHYVGGASAPLVAPSLAGGGAWHCMHFQLSS